MKNILLYSTLILVSSMAVAQPLQYRIIDDPNGTPTQDFIVYLDWNATNTGYSNVIIKAPSFIPIFYTEGTTISVSSTTTGTWALMTGAGSSLTKAQIDGIYGSANNPDGQAMQMIELNSTTTLGNRVTSPSPDLLFRIHSSTPITGKIHIGRNVANGTTPDGNLYNDFSLKGTLEADLAGPGTATGHDVPGAGGLLNLPVDLITFDVTAFNTHDAKLDWATASELNNSHFEVQRSFDGYNFTTIDEVKGNGTSHSLINYSYVDETIPTHQNIVYYRLNQIDYNGDSELSDVRLVQFEGFSNAPLVVYPNHTKSETTILLGDNVSQGEYTITDLVGKQWMADIVRAGSKSIELDFTNLPSGVYIATLNTENDSKHVRIVKK